MGRFSLLQGVICLRCKGADTGTHALWRATAGVRLTSKGRITHKTGIKRAAIPK
jgi:hypothetical protein